MNPILTDTDREQTLRTLTAMEARLLVLLKRQPYELRAVTRKTTPPAVRVKLLSFLPVLVAAGTHGHIASNDLRFWIDQQMNEIQGKPFTPFPFERHRRLLETLVIRGCLRRGELVVPQAAIEAELRANEAEYRRRYGDAAYHRLIEQGEVPSSQEEAA